jgi:predicted metal-dependent enzyme (double-stranded beta helix superfamily)
MFDVDTLVSDCIQANQESEPQRALREVLARAVAPGSGIADALPPERAGIEALHVSPELTVINVVWAPGMTLYPHDHRMWAAIGIYSGGEDNTFYRRANDTIVESGGKQLRPADVCLLGHDTVHAVTNPTAEFAGAVHIYGGDFFTTPRSEWDPDTFDERPFDVDAALAHFVEQNARFAG